VVYAGVGNRLFRTLDGGETWRPMSEGWPEWTINVLKNDPLDPRAVYAGSTYSGLMRSTDLGASWSQVRADRIDHVEFDSLNPSRLWIAGRYQVSLSPDAGRSWYIFRPSAATLQSFALDRSDPNNLYAAAAEGLFPCGRGPSALHS